ncbi:CoA-binding domain protein [Thermoclostridium stercorarium subsp. stercorarium DSM 8532]|jgi:predicted CoA-binding protein|uniref:CoA-binding domain protein n=3 Tax=Thermoclostridium stercorarium TaxID=1510 RepID=L7VLJ2_THES1|nr:CoA-binding protein [Thermoclostridium stercorarium]AGC67509.1 CoA-binding domain protein [Thermoclostridium stercorarium subsp. stercorarium DSM 8532]ANW97936.1 CoA-binding protein [Thermoclostridium stercorarium subsp. thermolacticum DSM 2910]ANX00486.1 CoA-binding protein [Thermoclostridium stercorarium subsp. leptospartum DSM 9219]UZQ86095.1 CoA-binding protein [Thermoclostridium stercorarium]
MLEELMLGKKVWAVVGANQNPEKYGNMIYRKLRLRGYEVYAVNPLYDVVEGDPCYKDLSSLPKIPDVVNMVVSPKRSKNFVEEAAGLGIKYIWFQPGTYDEEVLDLAKKLGLETVQACVLVATR